MMVLRAQWGISFRGLGKAVSEKWLSWNLRDDQDLDRTGACRWQKEVRMEGPGGQGRGRRVERRPRAWGHRKGKRDGDEGEGAGPVIQERNLITFACCKDHSSCREEKGLEEAEWRRRGAVRRSLGSSRIETVVDWTCRNGNAAEAAKPQGCHWSGCQERKAYTGILRRYFTLPSRPLQ